MPLNRDVLWDKDAIIYQGQRPTFHDSNGDGIGDFQGLEGKLDYLQKLGINAIWLLPFFPSPLRDDGYDISDYVSVHPSYGTLGDFTAFLEAAGVRAGFHLDRSAHRQHERGHEGYAERDVEVLEHGHAAGRSDSAIDMDAGARDPARGTWASVGGDGGGRGGAAGRGRAFRICGYLW